MLSVDEQVKMRNNFKLYLKAYFIGKLQFSWFMQNDFRVVLFINDKFELSIL